MIAIGLSDLAWRDRCLSGWISSRAKVPAAPPSQKFGARQMWSCKTCLDRHRGADQQARSRKRGAIVVRCETACLNDRGLEEAREGNSTGPKRKTPGNTARRFLCISHRSREQSMRFTRSGGDLLSHVLRRSTISAVALNCRVRDGIGCFAHAITTRPRKTHSKSYGCTAFGPV